MSNRSVYSPYFDLMTVSTTVVEARGVLLRQRGHLTRDRARQVAELLAHEFAQAPLMAAVDIGVDQADRDPFDAAAGEARSGSSACVLVELDQDVAASR